MGECLFEPTATKMATISSGKAEAATPKEQHQQRDQPPKPPRASTADAGCEWSGLNQPDTGRDLRISARHPPHRHDPRSSSWKGPSGTIDTLADDSPGCNQAEPSRGRAHFDPPPLEDEDEGQKMHQSPPKIEPTLGIEREGNEKDQWVSPTAKSSNDEDQSLFYFTATSILSASTQESYWGLMESIDGSTVKEYKDTCNLTSDESKRDHHEVVWQLFETINKLELELTGIEDMSSLDSCDTQSCGSDETNWEQVRIHPTMRYKYKPINLFFERKCTSKTSTPIGEHTMTTQVQNVATNGSTMRGDRPYLGVTQQIISRLLVPHRDMALFMEEAMGYSNSRNRQDKKQLGKATQIQALLRRCFFPRRDVIRWSLFT
jgi:hypothetical protein